MLVLVWFDGLLPIRRSPLSMLNFIVSPLTILFFIYVFAGPSRAVFALGGGLVAVIVGSCIILETEAAFLRLVLKLQDMFVSSPLSAVTYVVGLSAAQLCNGIAGIVLFSALLGLYTNISALGGLEIALAAVITWVSISALGFMISTFARDVRDLWVYSPLINVALSFVSPVFYPISLIPAQVRFVAYLSPTTYPAQIIQQATGLVSASSTVLAFDFAGGIAYTLILVLLAAKLSKWRQ
ncbi:MAG: ABC transporter permease [Thaumarchaeota archaeon]|nr:ABC transporter permease [Nitrososphaerota archaeon]